MLAMLARAFVRPRTLRCQCLSQRRPVLGRVNAVQTEANDVDVATICVVPINRRDAPLRLARALPSLWLEELLDGRRLGATL
jgi:hypothetical protein